MICACGQELLSGQRMRHTLHFLPPYSPQLNPIELAWSSWKAATNAILIDQERNDDTLFAAIREGATSITADKCAHFMNHCTRFYVHCARSKPLDESYDATVIE